MGAEMNIYIYYNGNFSDWRLQIWIAQRTIAWEVASSPCYERGKFRRKNVIRKYMRKIFNLWKNNKKGDFGFWGFRESPGGSPPPPTPRHPPEKDWKKTKTIFTTETEDDSEF